MLHQILILGYCNEIATKGYQKFRAEKCWGVPGAKIGDGSVPESFITTQYYSISVFLDYDMMQYNYTGISMWKS